MHLWPNASSISGYFAVFAFYCLSGYLMTSILHDTYGFSQNGLWRFALNRLVRIYPLYWVVITFSFLFIWLNQNLAYSLNHGLQLPLSLTDWLLNIFIIGHIPPGNSSRLVPPVWSLHVELVFYFLMALFLSRKVSYVIYWLIISAIFTAVSAIFAVNSLHDFRNILYFSSIAGSLPFSVGALLSFTRKKEAFQLKFNDNVKFYSSIGLSILSIVALSIAYTYIGTTTSFIVLFYLAFAVNIIVVFLLIQVKSKNIPPTLNRIDRILGDLSYPVYLSHWPISLAITYSIFSSIKPSSPVFFASSYMACILFSIIVDRLVDRPLQNKVRSRIRPTKRD